MKKGKKSYKRDLILVAALLAAALLLLLLVTGNREETPGAEAVVSVDGAEVGRYPLSRDGVFPLNGGSNILVIEDGEAWVSEASCPDQICRGMGKISRNGEFIACLPNRVIIVIEGGEASLTDAKT